MIATVRDCLRQAWTPPPDRLRPPPLVPHTFTVALLALAGAAGLAVEVGQPASTVLALLPEPGYRLWGLSLMIGAGLALVGVVMRDWLAGLLWERLGLTLLVPASAVYVLLAWLALGAGAFILPVFTVSAITVGGAVRVWQIHRFIRGVTAAAAEGRESGE